MAGAQLTTAGEIAGAVEADAVAGWRVALGADAAVAGVVALHKGAAVLDLCWPEVWADADRLAPHLARARCGTAALVLVGGLADLGAVEVAALAEEVPRLLLLPLPVTPATLAVWLRGLGEGERLLRERADLERALERARYENELLIDIGRALSRKRDRDQLLDLILLRAREVTGADAGSVYVVEGDDPSPARRTLRFVESQNDSIAVTPEGFTMPVSPASIVGTCVLSGEAVAIPDLYALDPPGRGNNPWRFVHDRSFDAQHGYQTRSMVTLPMTSARGQVIGVIQLINKRVRGAVRLEGPADFETKVVPFDAGSIELASALASQAGIALENAQLQEEVRTLFEGFVRASVTAIEARDPTTSGHSERVATLTLGLARVVDRVDHGPYAGLTLSSDDLKQIEYAALLHDFGKVGVREQVLVKAQKLYDHERALIEARFEVIRRTIEAERDAAKFRAVIATARAEADVEVAAIERAAAARLAEVDEFVEFVLKANQPTVLEQGGFERIAVIASRGYRASDGGVRPYLSAAEAAALQIARGSLTEDERRAIEQHVVHTYKFLRQIPWGKTFRQVPEIAIQHHEKLDGTGYPHALRAADISPAARMMAIADIYDALTASDRPYKKAVPHAKAIEILGGDVERAKLDRDLFEMFVGARVWEQLGS